MNNNLVKVRSNSLANEALISNTPDLDNITSEYSLDQRIKIPTTTTSKLTHDLEDLEFCCLPVEIFPGALETVNGLKQPLKMPNLLDNVSSLTLPLRLDLLGNVSFEILAALNPIRVGNSILGYAYPNHFLSVLYDMFYNKIAPKKYLYLLPFVFSKDVAQLTLFLYLICSFIVFMIVFNAIGVIDISFKGYWIISVSLSIAVMTSLFRFRWARLGNMAFCHSLGVPEIEEFMFSYSWKKDEVDIRTLAKSLWNTGVGCWIDHVKLTPSDEIRSVVRSVVKNVRFCVVFMSKAYVTSPNCCVELAEAVAHPEKMWLVYLEDMDPKLLEYFKCLNPSFTCNGIDELIQKLGEELENNNDEEALNWWRSQRISVNKISNEITPTSDENWNIIPKFRFWGRPTLPKNSINVGPVYISGDCKTSGYQFQPPYHFTVALFALSISIQLLTSFGKITSTLFDIVWIFTICFMSFGPFFMFSVLFDNRVFCHESLRPLISTKAIQTGLMVDICGSSDDEIVINLREFLTNIGHLWNGDASSESKIPVIRVEVMNSLEQRDRLFHPNSLKRINLKRTIFIWNTDPKNPDINPFSDDEIGRNMMKVLVLVAKWEDSLASSLFSAIGIKLVDSLHPETAEIAEKKRNSSIQYA